MLKENILRTLISRYLPFWPIFAGLLVLGLLTAWIYLKTATPIYQATATLIIKDEKKGVDDAKLTESMNPFDSKKIVENEIEVIKSRKLMGEVVKNLNLYAPIFEDGAFSTSSGFSSSPISVQLKDPGIIPLTSDEDPKKYYFSYDSKKKQVTIEGKYYAVDEWTKHPEIGEIRFNQKSEKLLNTENDFYFSFINPRIVASGISRGLEVYSSNKLSTVVSMDFKDEDPERGEAILNQLIIEYGRKGLEDKKELAEGALTFIEDRMKEVEKELDSMEQKIQIYRASEGVVDLSEQGKLYLQDVGTYDRQISDITRQLAVLRKVRSYVNAKGGQAGSLPSTTGIADPVLAQLLEKLYTSEIKYSKLKETTGENNPLLSGVASDIQQLRPRILENIGSQISNLSASLSNLNESSSKSNTALNSIPEKERELLELTRRQAIKKEQFSFLQQKREETALSYAPTGGDGKVVDLAEAGLEPVSPKRLVAYLIALLLALGAGVAYVGAKEILNNKVLFRDEITEYTDIPVVGEISFMKKEDKKVDTETQEIILSEQFRNICTNLDLYNRDGGKKRILITSSIPGEGKSFVSARLAKSLARAGRSVVLIDMDFIKPFTTKSFDLSDKKGVLDFLNGSASYDEIINSAEEHDNMGIIAAGKLKSSAKAIKSNDYTGLLLKNELELLFKHLSNTYDYVIMDSAPVDLISDVNLLADFSDKTLLVVRHDYTPKQILKNLDNSNKLKSSENLHIVFNGLKNRGLGYGVYGYGQTYGQQYYAGKY